MTNLWDQINIILRCTTCVCVRELNGEQRRRSLNNESIVFLLLYVWIKEFGCENTCVKKIFGDQDFQP